MKRFLLPKKTLIIANGEKPKLSLLRTYLEHANLVIALDGAADWLNEQGFKADLIIGDMDSLDPHHQHQSQAIYIAEQDSNDLEKALRYCRDHGLLEITILGAYGLRLDHVLTNLFVLKKFASSLIITMAETDQCMFMCPNKEPLIFDNLKGAFISLFPLSETAGPISTYGVEYPLCNEVLSLNSRIGTLNRINSAQASVYCEEGDLLIVMPNAGQVTQLSKK